MEILRSTATNAKAARKGNFKKTFFYEDGIKYTFKGIAVPKDFGDQFLHVNGVLGYLGSYAELDGSFQKAEAMVEKYSKHIGYAYKGANKMEKRCKMIQKDFKGFREWCKSNIGREEMI